jgi:uncharacterized protein (TIGR02646 family)
MIRLHPVPRPAKLTDDKVKELTERYQREQHPVWNEKFIKDALLELSHGKCCYCECDVSSGGSYLEVEHFHPKSLYPEEVMCWENLLPACKRCNSHKSDHDTKQEPIIHPVQNAPQDHLSLKNYRLYGKTPLGDKTIERLDLNDRSRLVEKRFEIGNKLLMSLENLWCDLPTLAEKHIGRKRKQLVDLMLEGTACYEYSATAATVILQDENYQKAKYWFIQKNLWNGELVNLENGLLEAILR